MANLVLPRQQNQQDREQTKNLVWSVLTPDDLNKLLSKVQEKLRILYKDRLKKICLFGSYAKGIARAGSDVDLLVVVHPYQSYGIEVNQTAEVSAPLSLTFSSTISIIPVSLESWETSHSPLIRTVKKEGICIGQ